MTGRDRSRAKAYNLDNSLGKPLVFTREETAVFICDETRGGCAQHATRAQEESEE